MRSGDERALMAQDISKAIREFPENHPKYQEKVRDLYTAGYVIYYDLEEDDLDELESLSEFKGFDRDFVIQAIEWLEGDDSVRSKILGTIESY